MIYYDCKNEVWLDSKDSNFIIEMGILEKEMELVFADQKEFWEWYNSKNIII
jgi:hypothetical protein